MKIYITGEVTSKVTNKVISAIVVIEKKIKKSMKQGYGDGIVDWAYLVICCSPEWYEAGLIEEVKEYKKKNKELELRLIIDYDAVLEGNEAEVFRLICESFLRGVDIAENELKIKDFDFGAFRKDLTNSFKKEGWL